MAHDRLQRLAALRREGILTDAEYEAKRAALVDEMGETVQPTRNTQGSGRDVGKVVRGFIFGVPLGIVAVVYILLALPRERRGDVLFGAWVGTAVGGVALALILGVTGALGGSSQPSSSGPSRTADEVYAVAQRSVPTGCEEVSWPTLDRSVQYQAERDAARLGKQDADYNWFYWNFGCRVGDWDTHRQGRDDTIITTIRRTHTYNCYRLRDATLEVSLVVEGSSQPCPQP